MNFSISNNFLALLVLILIFLSSNFLYYLISKEKNLKEKVRKTLYLENNEYFMGLIQFYPTYKFWVYCFQQLVWESLKN